MRGNKVSRKEGRKGRGKEEGRGKEKKLRREEGKGERK